MNTIDYRYTAWGHNQYLKRTGDNVYTGPCFYQGNISLGDKVLWSTNYGYCEAQVRAAKRYRDPVDMFDIEVEVVKRHADPEIVSQEELDRHFS